ncbi:uncharacterized protein LOC106642772 [Copidosoma floridanum]|uniref:uncharacterized protein LOC106642772 n=1 Tax=Copidosoma floridanum TaxID=29053 RepID=UPI0006C9C01A|nr:uncharacterized protein LOC106642772 [Copidosoma floridanum]
MNDHSDFKENTTTPERKKQFVQYWLEGNLFNYYNSNVEKAQSVSRLNERCQSYSVQLNSPPRVQNPQVPSCTTEVSPVLGGKRLASPVIGGHRKVWKRIKLEKEFTTNETKEVKLSGIKLETTSVAETWEKCNKDDIKKSEYKIEVDDFFPSESLEIFNESDDSSPKLPKTTEHPTSQLIESVSSADKSHNHSQVVKQEILSVSDNTESDLIEELSTHLVLDTSCRDRHVILSQNISSPSSDSMVEENCVDTNKITATSIKQSPIETLTSTDPIDSVSTFESKPDFGKTSYILHYAEEKLKKKKIPKKGSLLEVLTTAMAKERSSVNLLRHQLQKKINIVPDKSFVLFQIIKHLPMNNGNQYFKCSVINDNMGVLNGLLPSKTNRLITVMNVPEISSLVNINEKPILKVYEPLIVLDPNQMLLHITKFIAIPSEDLEILNLTDQSAQGNNLKMIKKFDCPCMDEKVLSLKCKSKYSDTSNNIIRMLFVHH